MHQSPTGQGEPRPRTPIRKAGPEPKTSLVTNESYPDAFFARYSSDHENHWRWSARRIRKHGLRTAFSLIFSRGATM